MTDTLIPLENLSDARLVAALERRFDTVIDDVDVGDRTFSIIRPRNSDDLVREEDFVEDERLPYWADIWPASTILARQILERPGKDRRLLELGCGVGLVTTAAMAVNSYPVPSLALPKLNCPAWTMPASADAKPVMA